MNARDMRTSQLLHCLIIYLNRRLYAWVEVYNLASQKFCERYTQRLQSNSGPEKESLLIEMNNILSVFTGNVVTDRNFIEHRSMI